jgi:molybdopterin/thiamine biosynthesis adenylyltransferase
MPTTTLHPDLTRARVLVVGVGGLGAPAAAAVAAAGVGTLGLVDPDVVELSNLHRQPLYLDADLGRPKVEVAGARLRALHPALRVEPYAHRFTTRDGRLLDGFHVVLDGTDSIAAKFAVNDAAVGAGVPLVHAGVLGFRVQLSTILPGRTACYRCVFEEAPPPGDAPSCEEAGVMGPVPAFAAALQAAEAVHLLTDRRPAFAGRLLTVDLRAAVWRTIPLRPNPCCPVCATRAAHGARSPVP